MIEELLVIDPNQRLNSSSLIKNHEYFKEVNWKDAENKKIKVPYVPKTSGLMDLKYFEDVIQYFKRNSKVSLSKIQIMTMILKIKVIQEYLFYNNEIYMYMLLVIYRSL